MENGHSLNRFLFFFAIFPSPCAFQIWVQLYQTRNSALPRLWPDLRDKTSQPGSFVDWGSVKKGQKKEEGSQLATTKNNQHQPTQFV